MTPTAISVPMKVMFIVGAGDFAQIAARDFDERFKAIKLVVERDYLTPELKDQGVWAMEDLLDTAQHAELCEFFVAVTFSNLNKTRRRLYEQMKAKGFQPASFFSPLAIDGGATIGEHCYVQEWNNLQQGVVLGDNVILWAGNHIGHGSKIGSHTYIASHVVVSGNCEIGEGCFIGVNASIAHGVKIGDGCIIGAGTLITRDIPAGSVVKRNADRPIVGEKAEDWPL